MGKCGAKNGLSKVVRHISQLRWQAAMCLHRICDVIFWLRDRIAKFKTRQIKKYGLLAKIAKFNAHQVFPLYRTVIVK